MSLLDELLMEAQLSTRPTELLDSLLDILDKRYALSAEEIRSREVQQLIMEGIKKTFEEGLSITRIHLNSNFVTWATRVENNRMERLHYTINWQSGFVQFCGIPVVEDDTVGFGEYKFEIGGGK